MTLPIITRSQALAAEDAAARDYNGIVAQAKVEGRVINPHVLLQLHRSLWTKHAGAPAVKVVPD